MSVTPLHAGGSLNIGAIHDEIILAANIVNTISPYIGVVEMPETSIRDNIILGFDLGELGGTAQ
ncbi:MAG: hypothetical protein ACRD38_05515 [Nitrososphaerales archaeon]